MLAKGQHPLPNLPPLFTVSTRVTMAACRGRRTRAAPPLRPEKARGRNSLPRERARVDWDQREAAALFKVR